MDIAIGAGVGGLSGVLTSRILIAVSSRLRQTTRAGIIATTNVNAADAGDESLFDDDLITDAAKRWAAVHGRPGAAPLAARKLRLGLRLTSPDSRRPRGGRR